MVWGDILLRAGVLVAALAALLTETLSLFHLLRPVPLGAVWLLIGAGGVAWVWKRRRKLPPVRVALPEALLAGAIFAIACTVGLTALLSPPNSADAMAYHMPRVFYWAESGSVAFFPTPYFNQIMLQPLAEYLMLHTYVLSGGDHLVNLVAFAAFLGSIFGVAGIAAALGLNTRGQALAAFFCATLPNGILQASGAKNDWLLTFCLVAMVYFAARRDAPFLGLATGLALATKATAYLFAPPLLAVVLLWIWREDGRIAWKRIAACLAGGVLLLNTPQYLRNWRLSGSPMGYDSAQGDGFFRWRNEHPGWRSLISNALRNGSEQLGARSPRWNQAVYTAVVGAHLAMGLDPQDPDTTWRWSRYEPPINANHEANANNRWHLLLLAIAAATALFARSRWMLYAAGLLAGFLLFSFYLKWQPFLARLELPLFVLGAPLAGWLLGRKGRVAAIVTAAVCLFLLDTARLPALANWTRPLKGPNSLLKTPRDLNYFSDMSQWNNRASYLESVDRIAATQCKLVGLDINQNQVEYPILALVRERRPEVRFVHTGVTNTSARYYPPDPPQPCAILCLDCAGHQERIDHYQSLGPPVAIGQFLLFIRAQGATLTPQ